MSGFFYIGEKKISAESDPFVMLEVGINHNGEISLAKEMIRSAKNAGADAVKFQTFKAEEFVGDPELQFTYRSQGKEVTESMLEMFQRYEFSKEEWMEIKKICDEEKILFISTPQNVSDLELLLEIGVPALKVGSDDFTNIPLIRRYASTGLPLMLSCGMADLGEVHKSLDAAGAFVGNPILLMLCTSQYPTPPEDANLLKLRTLAGAFPGQLLGFSDHTQGSQAAIIASALGACAFEKHFTLDKNLPGPDHWFSEDPSSAAEWVASSRKSTTLLGNPLVVPTSAERDMRLLARRSITAICNIKSGEILTEENTGLRRPGNGLKPEDFELVLGKKVIRAITKGKQLQWEDFV